jgi:hypothetical protein
MKREDFVQCLRITKNLITCSNILIILCAALGVFSLFFHKIFELPKLPKEFQAVGLFGFGIAILFMFIRQRFIREKRQYEHAVKAIDKHGSVLEALKFFEQSKELDDDQELKENIKKLKEKLEKERGEK